MREIIKFGKWRSDGRKRRGVATKGVADRHLAGKVHRQKYWVRGTTKKNPGIEQGVSTEKT